MIHENKGFQRVNSLFICKYSRQFEGKNLKEMRTGSGNNDGQSFMIQFYKRIEGVKKLGMNESSTK